MNPLISFYLFLGIFDTLRLKSRQSGNGKNEGMHTFSFQFRRHYWKSDEIQSPESLLQKNKVMSNFFFHQVRQVPLVWETLQA